MAAVEATTRPEREAVFFLWQRGSKGMIPSILRGESPALKSNGDRPFILVAHELKGEFRDSVGDGSAGQEMPWTALAAAFPPPVSEPA